MAASACCTDIFCLSIAGSWTFSGRSGHAAAPGAINVPLSLIQKIGKDAYRNLGVDPDADGLLVICRSGGRSGVRRRSASATGTASQSYGLLSATYDIRPGGGPVGT